MRWELPIRSAVQYARIKDSPWDVVSLPEREPEVGDAVENGCRDTLDQKSPFLSEAGLYPLYFRRSIMKDVITFQTRKEFEARMSASTLFLL